MPRIFISYRRMDSQAIATLIYHRLVKTYGEKNVFLDTKTIRSGLWWEQVKAALTHADVVVVVVGPKWETEIQRRSDSGDDYVREEVRIALELNKSILLAFVDGENGVDPNLLPEDIRDLPKYQGYQILHEPFFDASMELLIENIPKTKRKLSLPFVFGVITLLIALIFGVIFVMNNAQNGGNLSDDTVSDSTEIVMVTSDSTEIMTATSDVIGTSVLPTPTQTPTSNEPMIIESVYIADGYDSPVGTAEERASNQILPDGWVDTIGFATLIGGGTTYNTGADINLATGDDLGSPVYAIASGVVTFSDELPIWGNTVIIRHDPLLTVDGVVAYSRYNLMRNVTVRDGDRVTRGQQIGEIGNGQGQFPPYLNFDISTTTIFEENPDDYPRLDLDRLLENYVDPLEFIRENRPSGNLACVPTPYDGKTFVWHWRGNAVTEETLIELVDNLDEFAPNVSGIIVKVLDGETWQGSFDSGDMAINGVDDIARWVMVLEEYGLELHIWAVPKGVNIATETELLASVANVDGVQSLILDVEPYTGYWQGGEESVEPFMTSLREQITNPDFHIGLMIDPRPQNYDAIFPDEWRDYVDSIHPLVYWSTFRQIPEDTLQVMWETWGGYGL
ncbi:MAG: M23 family metallopeptidase, partial [Anaerolineae bacterium]|nr:M23 family metallopeptidase [Anaerolineae bacterium]